MVHGINTVFLTTTNFLLFSSFHEVVFLLVLKGILTPINDLNLMGLGLILSLFDTLVFLSFFANDIFSFSNDIFLIIQPNLVNSIALIGAIALIEGKLCFELVPGTRVKSFGRKRIDLSVKLLLIFLFTSILLQHIQQLSPSPFSWWTFKVIGSHPCIHSLSRRLILGLELRGDSFLSQVVFSS